jgi:hypothetical protein
LNPRCPVDPIVAVVSATMTGVSDRMSLELVPTIDSLDSLEPNQRGGSMKGFSDPVAFDDVDDDDIEDERTLTAPVRVKREIIQQILKQRTNKGPCPSPGHALVNERHKWIEDGYGGMLKPGTAGKQSITLSEEAMEAKRMWLMEDERRRSLANEKHIREIESAYEDKENDPNYVEMFDACEMSEKVRATKLVVQSQLCHVTGSIPAPSAAAVDHSVLDESYDALFDAVNSDNHVECGPYSSTNYMSESLQVDSSPSLLPSFSHLDRMHVDRPVSSSYIPSSLFVRESIPSENDADNSIMDDSYYIDPLNTTAVEDDVFTNGMMLIVHSKSIENSIVDESKHTSRLDDFGAGALSEPREASRATNHRNPKSMPPPPPTAAVESTCLETCSIL